MPLAHRRKQQSWSRVKCVVNDASFSDGWATDNDSGGGLFVISWLTVANAMMPCAKRVLNERQTNGSFSGTNDSNCVVLLITTSAVTEKLQQRHLLQT